MNEKAQVSAKVDADVWRAVRIKAIDEGITAGEILNQAIREFMGMDEPSPKPKPAPKKQRQTVTGSDPGDVEKFILEHDDAGSAKAIAEMLNQAGYTSVSGGAFTGNIVGKIRNRMKQEGRR